MKTRLRILQLSGPLFFCGSILLASPVGFAIPEVVLAGDGKAGLEIVIGSEADETVRTAAADLADYLERISGASFNVAEGDGRRGLVLGVPADFPALPFTATFGSGPFERDDYLLRSTEEGLYLLGATPLAASFAVWDLLYQFGYRYFFPTQTWEIIPNQRELRIAVDRRETPDYYTRRGPRGAPRMHRQPWARDGWEKWQVRNRTASSFRLHTGHVYGHVIRANQQAFDENPEYWGMVNGERSSRYQPNIAHPEVQRIFIDYALDTLRNQPERDSVSMDPRDENRWSESRESQAIGRPSEQAVFIANLVAEAIVEEFGAEKYVGIYGYGHHSPPPAIDVHPNVIVSLATAGRYIRGGYSLEEMFAGWAERSNMLGVRDYYSLTVWRGFLPGRNHAGRIEYIRTALPRYHALGARFMNAESDNCWGGTGLGYYLSSRVLWNVAEAERLDELVEDFLEKSFGLAKEPVREFYRMIDGSATDPHLPTRRQPLNDDLMFRMYNALAEARSLAEGQTGVMARLDDLVLYTRFVDLYRLLNAAEPENRQARFEELAHFAWRIRERLMAPSINMLHHLDRFFVRRDDHIAWPENGNRSSFAAALREQKDIPFEPEEIALIVEDGLARHERLSLDVEFNEFDYTRLIPVGLEPVESPARPDRPWDGHRGQLHLYLWTDNGQLPLFRFSAGHIYRDRGPLRWELFDAAGNRLEDGEIAPDNPAKSDWAEQEGTHTVDLQAPAPGLYRLIISNTGQGYFWDYEARGAKLTMQADPAAPLRRTWLNQHYFYVPLGMDRIVIAGTLREGRHSWHPGTERSETIDPGKIEVSEGFTVIPVPEGRDGNIWMLRVHRLSPELRFLNIPGLLAYCPSELLLPPELVAEMDP